VLFRSLDEIANLLDTACEGKWTVERMHEVGERIWNLERRFNLDAGMSTDEDTLPQRILKEAAKSGSGKGKVCELDKMLPEYYELRGWTPDGEPTTQTLQRFGLV